VIVLPADNPQQAETALSMGLKSLHFCRFGQGGGPDAYKESDDGYDPLFHVWFFAFTNAV
jgi:hypothetical protein